jgi:hypothetical protein
MRVALLPKKRDAFTAIKRFMIDADVELRKEENEILNRWFFCDALLRAKSDDEAGIMQKIKDQFNVSIYTARNDIYFTQKLFGECRKINKKYLYHEHLARIDRDIEKIRKALFRKYKDDETGEEYEESPDAKEIMALAKLHESYTYTLNCIPEEQQEDKQPPPIFQFILAPGQMIERPMQIEDALSKADKIINMKQNSEGVYASEEK